MHIVYLDQNKWVEIARAVKYPDENPDVRLLVEAIVHEVSAEHIALPLTSTNIYETYKINDANRRRELAYVQALLSRGLVFRGRHKRLEAEIIDVLRSAHGLPPMPRERNWFLSSIFFEAVAEWNDERLGGRVSSKALEFIQRQPAFCLYQYLAATPDDLRITATRTFSDGSEILRQRIEERRRQNAHESLSLRRRVQSALLLINEIELILEFANRTGLPWKTAGDMGRENARRIVNEVPTYYIERELALRLEAQSRPIEENDFRDMQSFCAIVPYANDVVGEKQFVSLARQTKLDKKYHTRIITDLLDLRSSIE